MSYRTLLLVLVLYTICIDHITTTCCDAASPITLDLTSFHGGNLFYAQLKAGWGHKEKTFNMLVATSYHVTWIQKDAYGDHPQEHINPAVSHLKSTACKYGNHMILTHTNRMQVGPQVVDGQQFAVAYRTGTDRPLESGIDGILGLNDGLSKRDNVHYLFYNLYRQRYIDHLIYSLYINNTQQVADQDQEQLPAGALVLGGVDSKYYTGQLQYVELEQIQGLDINSNWTMKMLGIQLDWSRAGPEKLNDSISRLGSINMDVKPAELKLDSSLIYYIGEKSALDTIHMGILKAEPILRDNFYVFDCRLDNKPDFVFTLSDSFELRITPEEYVVKYQLKDRQVCLSAFKPCQEDVWIFGTKLLRKYYTVFDYENHRVGFATPT